MLSQLGAVQMAVDTHLAVLATVALYVILCIEVRCLPSTLSTLLSTPYALWERLIGLSQPVCLFFLAIINSEL